MTDDLNHDSNELNLNLVSLMLTLFAGVYQVTGNYCNIKGDIVEIHI